MNVWLIVVLVVVVGGYIWYRKNKAKADAEWATLEDDLKNWKNKL